MREADKFPAYEMLTFQWGKIDSKHIYQAINK